MIKLNKYINKMNSKVFTPWLIYENIQICFEKYRNGKISTKKTTQKEFKDEIEIKKYFKVTAELNDGKKIIALILSNKNNAPEHSGPFERLIKQISELKTLSAGDVEIMIIGKQKPNTYVKNIIKSWQQKGYVLNYHNQNIFKNEKPAHILADKHIILSDEETKKILKQDYSTKQAYPLLLINHDPVAIWLGIKKGDFVKIVTRNEISGVAVSYRYAI
jgi:DNA-directed RNA polymerase subunit H (RpoH/RPB5)